MNYLAHLLLSDGTPEGLVGNLAGDFVSGIDLSSVDPCLLPGIHQHRAVDRFTDSHELVRASRLRLDPAWRHWRGILVDVFYDHLLAREFEEITGQPLAEFSGRVYRALHDCREMLPPSLKRAAPIMIEHDWLNAYAHERGLREILARMSLRSSRAPRLHDAVDELVALKPALREDFRAFFPELQKVLAANGANAVAQINPNPDF